MTVIVQTRKTAVLVAAIVLISAGVLEAATPTAQQALKLVPVQKGVDVSQPTTEEISKCAIRAGKIEGKVGWVVEDPDGLVLRRFVDTNGDNVVDQWSYFKDGVEVYRDVDANFNGKADQYGWFHTGGSRWGTDRNEDGTIDTWKRISAEEVTAEVVAALAGRSPERFARLVLTADELQSLGLGKDKAKSIAAKIDGLGKDFRALVAKEQVVPATAKWIQFSGTRPGVVPAGTDGSSKDLLVYENVMAVVQAGASHSQVQIGTLIQVGDTWRVIDLPQGESDGQADVAASGIFFQSPTVHRGGPVGAGPSEKTQELLDELEKLDQTADTAKTPEQKVQYNARRAALLEKIAKHARSPEDRAMWIRQLADMVSAAVQQGTFADGAKRLEVLSKELKDQGDDESLVAYVKFRQLTAAYVLDMQEEKADFAKIQAQWLEDLEQFVADYPKASDTAEAMLQLAISQEFAGEEDGAKKWYGRIAKEFANSTAARKAAGARFRLDSVGKPIRLTGKSISGTAIDLSKYRGRIVLIQYWATWCEPCKRDLPALKELVQKYGKSFSVIGVSLDGNREDLAAYLTENRLPWPHIYEEGGLDSRPANQMGILTLPTMILVDQSGKVVSRNAQVVELDGQLKKLIGTPPPAGRLSGRRSTSR